MIETIQRESIKRAMKEVKKAMRKERSKGLGGAKTESPAPKLKNSGKNSNKNSKEKKNKLQKNLQLTHQQHQSQRRITRWARVSARRTKACDIQEDLVISQSPQISIRFKQGRRSRRVKTRWQQKQRQRALNQEMLWENHYMQQAGQEVSTYRRQIREQYGFVVDWTKPLWKNCTVRINKLTTAHSLTGNFIWKLTCHKLTDCHISGTDALLGLGLNFCIKRSSTTKTTDGTFNWMRNNVRRIYAFAKHPPEEREYNHKLHIK